MPLLPNVRPRHRQIGFVASLERGQAVLQVLDAVEQLGVAIRVDEHAGEAAALGDVEHVIAVSERVELAPKTRSEIFCTDDSRHG